VNHTERNPERELDRLRELASIGAGHAATALAQLTGRTCEMTVPRLRAGSAGARAYAGVLFECHGGPGGVLALLFSADTCRRLLDRLLGEAERELSSAESRSVLCEVGNILASHAANAFADLLGEAVMPSVPELALEDADSALADFLSRRGTAGAPVWLESAIADRAHELEGVFIFIPEGLAEATPLAS